VDGLLGLDFLMHFEHIHFHTRSLRLVLRWRRISLRAAWAHYIRQTGGPATRSSGSPARAVIIRMTKDSDMLGPRLALDGPPGGSSRRTTTAGGDLNALISGFRLGPPRLVLHQLLRPGWLGRKLQPVPRALLGPSPSSRATRAEKYVGVDVIRL
jgi:hypothetical protein